MELYKIGYAVTATLKRYDEIEGNQDKKDLIKILTVKVEYTVNNKSEKNEITRLIIKNSRLYKFRK